VYRQIVKRLHPDINPAATDAEKDLFIKAQAAYDLSDLFTLNAILLSLENAGVKMETTPPNLKETVATLEEHVSKLKTQIEKLEKQFPFTFREKLADEVWVEAERQQLDDDIAALAKEKEKYSEYLILLKEWKPSPLKEN
jgi:predicted  nucleic acid-binding Zn-ribbon protein